MDETENKESNERILDKKVFLQQQTRISSGDGCHGDTSPHLKIQTGVCSSVCCIHKTEIIRFYCQEHDVVGCVNCIKVDHTTCKVVPVQDVSTNYDSSEDFSKVKHMINLLEKEISSRKNEIKHNLKSAEEMKIKVVEEIKRFRALLNSYLDHAEKQMLKEVEQLNMIDVTMLTTLEHERESLEYEMKDLMGNLDKCADSISNLFVTTKLAEKRLQACRESIEVIASENQIKIYRFEPSEDMLKFKVNHTPIGVIPVQTEHVKKCADFLKKQNVKASNEGNCHIRGLTMLSPGEILLADSYNKSLKILNVKENKITSRYTPSAEPWDVTAVQPGMAAATIPSQGMILFMKTSNGLSESHCLKVRSNCRGIDYRNGEIAVSFLNPPAVQVLNIRGEVQREVVDTSLFDSPGYLAFGNDNGSIFVSDFNRHAVYEITKTGTLKRTVKHKNLQYPRGIVVTKDGNVIVCSQGTGRISRIAQGSGEIVPIDVKHIQQPFAITVCEEQDKMYICEFYPDCNYMKTFVWK